MRSGLNEEGRRCGARLHIPLVVGDLDQLGMGGQGWLKQPVNGFPNADTVGLFVAFQ